MNNSKSFFATAIVASLVVALFLSFSYSNLNSVYSADILSEKVTMQYVKN